jgi:hypothetical protein
MQFNSMQRLFGQKIINNDIIMNHTIRYGTIDNNIDVTNIVLEKCIFDDIIYIPHNWMGKS